MTRYLLFLFFVVPMSFGLQPKAFSEVNPIYVVDMQRVIAESIIGKATKSDIEEEVKKRQTRLEKQKNDFEAMKGEMEGKKGVLSSQAYEEKSEALRKKSRDLQRSIQDEQEALRRKKDQEVSKVIKLIHEVVSELGKEKGIKAIVEKDPGLVVFVSSEYDLTEDVIERLDEKKTS